MYFVYIMTNRSKTLYVGITNNLIRRVREHKTGTGSGFTARYNLDRLVYFERFEEVHNAIEREKRIKGWLRIRKIALIVSVNPAWKDLSEEWFTRHMYQPDKQVPPLASCLLRRSTDSVGITGILNPRRAIEKARGGAWLPRLLSKSKLRCRHHLLHPFFHVLR